MNLHQLKYLCEVSDHGFNITRAAVAVNTSQPGISKQLSSLESELGVDILVRRGNRIVGLTAAGSAVLQVARRILNDVGNLQRIREEFGTQDSGRFVIATTHTHARYILPAVIRSFRKRYPKVQLLIRQENATAVANLVVSGQADMGVSAEPPEPHADLIMLPCYRLLRSLIMPPRHPLGTVRSPSLAAIAQYPIITLDTSFTAGHDVLDAFAKAGVAPTVAMTATDVDVVKSYVELEIGIAVVPSITITPSRDRRLRAVDVTDLFRPSIACMMFRRNHYLVPYMLEFAHLVAPQWTADAVARAVESQQVPDQPVTTYGDQRRRQLRN